MSQRNNIELQAILALKLISDLIIFVFDPTPACGYNIDSQIDLYHEITHNFSKEGKIDIIIVFNKMDLAKVSEIEYLKNKLNLNGHKYINVNALSGENLEELISYLSSRYE
jgi:nucleolar GTP-binding protein